MQDCSNSIANALELLQSCTKPSICKEYFSTFGVHSTWQLYDCPSARATTVKDMDKQIPWIHWILTKICLYGWCQKLLKWCSTLRSDSNSTLSLIYIKCGHTSFKPCFESTSCKCGNCCGIATEHDKHFLVQWYQLLLGSIIATKSVTGYGLTCEKSYHANDHSWLPFTKGQ